MTRIMLAPAAASEIADAACAYEATSPGMGRQFLAELDRAIDGVRAHPFAAIAPGCRRCMLRRFAYAAIYRVVGSDAQLLALLAKRPGHGTHMTS
ncbi:MAG: hypothetical protein AAF628_38015 [Planctomycetota bacterium]